MERMCGAAVDGVFDGEVDAARVGSAQSENVIPRIAGKSTRYFSEALHDRDRIGLSVRFGLYAFACVMTAELRARECAVRGANHRSQTEEIRYLQRI